MSVDPSFDQILAWWKAATYRQRRRFLRRNLKPPFSFFLYKYKSVNVETLPHIADLLLESRFYLSSPDQVNDPFDTSGFVQTKGTTAEWRARLKKLIADKSGLNHKQRKAQLDEFMSKPREVWIKAIESAHYKNVKKVGLCSFTTLPKSVVMWSHYANQHSGICFQFERAKDSTGALIFPIPLLYVDQYPVLNWLQDDRGMEGVLRHKHKGWEYESEWRIFIPDSAHKFMNFSPSALAGLILGARVSKNSIAEIKKLLVARSAKGLPEVKLYKMALHRSKYKLIVQPFSFVAE